MLTNRNDFTRIIFPFVGCLNWERQTQNVEVNLPFETNKMVFSESFISPTYFRNVTYSESRLLFVIKEIVTQFLFIYYPTTEWLNKNFVVSPFNKVY